MNLLDKDSNRIILGDAMKIKLCVEPMKYSRQEDEIDVADGLTDEQIDDLVQDDLASMSAEMVDAWWERVE